MAAQQAKQTSAWFDATRHTPLIAEKAQRMESFIAANGHIDLDHIAAQEGRLVALMEEIEPQLGTVLHEKVTHLLCELTVFNFMQAMSSVQQARPKSVFRG